MKKKIQKYFKIGELKKFIKAELKKKQIRADYEELLVLALIFFGEPTTRKIKKPGCTTKSRWIHKAIYCLKMYLFRNESGAGIQKVKQLGDMCLFICFVYIQYWYDCTNPTHALLNDIEFINRMKAFQNINSNISEEALIQFTKDHLWYMGYHLSGLAFLDERISEQEKRRMVEHLKTEKTQTEQSLRKMMYVPEKNYKPHDCMSKKSLTFFEIMGFTTSFFSKDPATWETDEEYKYIKKEISFLKVVNDPGERALAGIKKINFQKEDTIQKAIVSSSYQRNWKT